MFSAELMLFILGFRESPPYFNLIQPEFDHGIPIYLDHDQVATPPE